MPTNRVLNGLICKQHLLIINILALYSKDDLKEMYTLVYHVFFQTSV